MPETKDGDLTLEQMREKVRAADEAEAERAAAEKEKVSKPYLDFVGAKKFKDILAEAEELRSKYVGVEEHKFTMLNGLVSIMKRM